MDHFHYQNGELYAEACAVADIIKRWGTPTYIYSRATLEHHYQVFDAAFAKTPHTICFAVKANSNLAVLQILAKSGSGFDIVSAGELERVLQAGGDPQKTVFSGVGKLEWEIQRALDVNIGCINVESHSELIRIHDIARKLNKVAKIAIRVNPDINARTHPYISTGLKENKFGVDIQQALPLYQAACNMPHLKIMGVACHIGSQLTELEPFLEACTKIYQFIMTLKANGIQIEHLDLGGGLGVCYIDEQPPSPAQYAHALLQNLPDKSWHIMIEPGRAIAANAGILVTKIEYLKHTAHKNFAIVDAGMNDLLRPALYEAVQKIISVHPKTVGAEQMYDIVGPVCETADFLGRDRQMILQEGDLLAVRTAGAYGFTMSSNYNSRPRAAEVMVDGNQAYLVRERETVSQLFAGEKLLPGRK